MEDDQEERAVGFESETQPNAMFPLCFAVIVSSFALIPYYTNSATIYQFVSTHSQSKIFGNCYTQFSTAFSFEQLEKSD